MEQTLIKKQKNVINFILENQLISSSTIQDWGDQNGSCPQGMSLSFPITALISNKNKQSNTIFPSVLNYSSTSGGFADWYA